MLGDIFELMKKHENKVWVLYNNEGMDEFFKKYFFSGIDTNTFCFVSQEKIYLIVCSLDADNLAHIKYDSSKVEVLLYDNNDMLIEKIEDVIASLKFPNKISLSYSTMGDISTDILTHGSYIYLKKLLKMPYTKYSKKVKFVSAEKIMYDIASKKTKLQIERLKILASLTDDILKLTFKNLKLGLTEKEIVEKTKVITDELFKNIIEEEKYNIAAYDMAWENCPIVLTGDNLAKGGHSLPSNRKLKAGDTIYFDFGIKAIFKDGMVLYTDIQRMGYAKKKNESRPPKSVMKVFNTLVSAIEEGIDELKPDVKGYVVDSIVRGKILHAGYPDYNHATGHPVGLKVHDIGAVISIKQSKRANLSLTEGGVYTLEPRINIANGGSIEEMVLITKYGGVPLCNTQKEIYIVN